MCVRHPQLGLLLGCRTCARQHLETAHTGTPKSPPSKWPKIWANCRTHCGRTNRRRLVAATLRITTLHLDCNRRCVDSGCVRTSWHQYNNPCGGTSISFFPPTTRSPCRRLRRRWCCPIRRRRRRRSWRPIRRRRERPCWSTISMPWSPPNYSRKRTR